MQRTLDGWAGRQADWRPPLADKLRGAKRVDFIISTATLDRFCGNMLELFQTNLILDIARALGSSFFSLSPLSPLLSFLMRVKGFSRLGGLQGVR